jgi:hypothetical protein
MPDIVLDTIFTGGGFETVPVPGIQDTFDRPNAPTLGSTSNEGRPWQRGSASGAAAPTFSIVNNRAVLTAATAGNAIGFVEGYDSDGTVGADLAVVPTGKLVGLAFRIVDLNNYLYVTRRDASIKRWSLFERVDGAGFKLAEVGAASEPTAGDRPVVILDGPNITLHANGSDLFTYATTRFQTATKHGIYGGNDGVGVEFDNFLFTAAD